MSDGTYQAKLSQTPLNFSDEHGIWREIDTNLSKESTTVGKANIPAVALTPASLQEDLEFTRQVSGSSPLTLEGESYSLTLNMLGACEGIPQAEGNVSTYKKVAPSTDLSYEVLTNGIKETLYLSNKDAPTEFSFNMRLSGLESRETSRGLALFNEGENDPVYTFGDLIVFDSSKNGADEPAYDKQAVMTYEKTASGLTFTYHLSKEWLSDPARVFPVQVDPSITKNSSDTFVSSAFPNTNYATSNILKVGRYDSSTGYNRGLLRFGVGEIPSNAYIDSAILKLYQTHTYYTNTAKTAYLGLVKKNWTSSDTWNSLNCAKNDARTYDPYLSKSFAGRGVWVSFDVLSAVRNWTSGAKINYGFCLYQKEGDAAQEPESWRKFASANASVEHKPYLVVNYALPNLGKVEYSRSVAGSPDPSRGYVQYTAGEEAALSAPFTLNHQDHVTSARIFLQANTTSGTQTNAFFAWLRDAPDSAVWQSYPLSPAQGGGYIALRKGASNGEGNVTLVPSKCSSLITGSGDNAKRIVKAVFVFTDSFPSKSLNYTQSTLYMAGGLTTTRTDGTNTCALVPSRSKNVLTSIETTLSPKYFKLNEKYPLNDVRNFNNETDAGRGSVTINWQKNPQATGYKVTFYDGERYREVADIPNGNATTWSSAGSGVFPADSTFKAAPQDSITAATLFSGAQSPSKQIS